MASGTSSRFAEVFVSRNKACPGLKKSGDLPSALSPDNMLEKSKSRNRLTLVSTTLASHSPWDSPEFVRVMVLDVSSPGSRFN